MGWVPKNVSDVPETSLDALRTAMIQTGTSDDQFDDLAWIMAQESMGKVGARNHSSTAAGLFQLTHVNYGLMPRGKASIGDAVDECIGGIRYIRQRYHDAKHARQFWEIHQWY
jgi:hypothetical protein